MIQSQIHECVLSDLGNLRECISVSRRVAIDETDPNMGWEHETKYTFANGETLTLSAKSTDIQVLPASPGFEQLCFERPDGDPMSAEVVVQREIIIGWSLHHGSGYSYVDAITTGGEDGGSWNRTFKALKLPDGRIAWHAPYLYDEVQPTFDDEAAWIAEARRVWAAQLKKETAAAQCREYPGKPCPRCGLLGDTEEDIPF